MLSLGGGVQSSAMLLMALEGRFGDKPDLALFVDPGWESRATYEWLKLLTAHVSPFPVVTISDGNIRTNASPRAKRDGKRFVTVPAYLEGGGMGRRQCTNEFKLKPIRRHFRDLGATAQTPVECWIGISTDEAGRIKPSQVRYAVNRWPLIEANLNRRDCADYLQSRMGAVAPKSSCIGCPFHDDRYWARLRAESPEEFEDACRFDDEIREGSGTIRRQFLHRSCTPLRQIGEFRHEKQGAMFVDAFDNECEGVCGV